MKNAAAVVTMSLLLSATAIRSAAQSELPRECAHVDFSAIGRPIIFPVVLEGRTGLSLGISAPVATFSAGEPVTLDVWAINQSDSEQWVASCSEVDLWTWNLQPFDSQDRPTERRGEKEEQHNPALKLQHELFKCYRNVALLIAPHSCSPIYDNGHVVTTDMAKSYDLSPGNYFVSPKNSTLPLKGLPLVLTDKKRSDDATSR